MNSRICRLKVKTKTKQKKYPLKPMKGNIIVNDFRLNV